MVKRTTCRSRTQLEGKRSSPWVASLVVFLIAAALAGCTQATIVPSPTPTPTPVPTATPRAPVLLLENAILPSPDPDRLARVTQIFSLVPEGYSTAVFMDIRALDNSPILRDAVNNLEGLGLHGILPAAATSLLDGIGVALGEHEQGPITLLDGEVDIESLLQLAGGFGLSINGVESQIYRGHKIWSLNVLGFTLAVGEADAATVVATSASPIGGPPASELVKIALDSFDGVTPRMLDNPGTQRLINKLPSGFLTTLLSRCDEIQELASIIDMPNCTGAAISAEPMGRDRLVINGIVRFQDEGTAAAAMQMAVQRLEDQGRLSFGGVMFGQEAELVWSLLIVDSAQVVEALKAFSFPQQ